MVRRGVERVSRQGEKRSQESGREHQPESGDEPTATYLRIDEVSKRTGLSKRTLRYYEELGLLEEAHRSEGNYRMYRVEDVNALQRIKEMRDLLGLELSEIREMVGYELEREQARSRWRHDSAPASRLSAIADAERVTREQLRLIETRLEALDRMGQSLRERLATYDRLRAEIMSQITQPDGSDEEQSES